MATAIEKVRLLIGDTESVQFTDDAQIQMFLDMASNSIYVAAALALESWAASLADAITTEKIGDYSYSKQSAARKLTLAKQYREVDAKTPYLTWAELDLTGEEE